MQVVAGDAGPGFDRLLQADPQAVPPTVIDQAEVAVVIVKVETQLQYAVFVGLDGETSLQGSSVG
ncbi:hypothetical protein D3C81_2291390 [compost metagenome]